MRTHKKDRPRMHLVHPKQGELKIMENPVSPHNPIPIPHTSTPKPKHIAPSIKKSIKQIKNPISYITQLKKYLKKKAVWIFFFVTLAFFTFNLFFYINRNMDIATGEARFSVRMLLLQNEISHLKESNSIYQQYINELLASNTILTIQRDTVVANNKQLTEETTNVLTSLGFTPVIIGGTIYIDKNILSRETQVPVKGTLLNYLPKKDAQK
jgi:hypothetical protein